MPKRIKIVPLSSEYLKKEIKKDRESDSSSVSSDLETGTPGKKENENGKPSNEVKAKPQPKSFTALRNELKAKIVKEVMDEVMPDIGAYDIDGNVSKAKVERTGRVINFLKFLGLMRISFHETILQGDYGRIEKYITEITTGKKPNPALINQYNEEGRTPLALAVNLKRSDVVEMLLKNGALPDIVDEGTGRTPLMYSIILKDVRSLKLVLQHGATVNLCDFQCITPLMLAAVNNDLNAGTMLVERLADVDAQVMQLARVHPPPHPPTLPPSLHVANDGPAD